MSGIRKARLAAPVLATILAVTGCGSGASATGGTTTHPTGTLKLLTDKLSWKSYFGTMSNLSQGQNQIQLDVAGYPDQNQYTAILKQSFRTDSPGLFTWHVGDDLKQLVDQNLVADTSAIWAKAISDGFVSQDLEKAYTYNGKQYCVPLSVSYWGMYYNKKLFQQNSISVPTSWQQLMDAAATLKSKGVTPFFQTTTTFPFAAFQTMVAGSDASLYNGLATGATKFTDPRIVSIMNDWLAQERKGWFTDGGSTAAQGAQLLKQGNVAMMNMGSWFGQTFKTAGMTSSDYGYFTIPSINAQDGKTPVAVETAPLCVGASSKQKDLGLAYSQWWMTPAAETAWSDARGDVAFNPKATPKDPEMQALGATVAGDKYQTVSRFYELLPVAIRTVALEQFSEFEAHPGDPLTFLTKIQDAADKYWASQK